MVLSLATLFFGCAPAPQDDSLLDDCAGCDVVSTGAIGSSCSAHSDCGEDLLCHPTIKMCTLTCHGACPGSDTYCVEEPDVYASESNDDNSRWTNELGGICAVVPNATVGCPSLPNFEGNWVVEYELPIYDRHGYHVGNRYEKKGHENYIVEATVPRWDGSEEPVDVTVCMPTTKAY